MPYYAHLTELPIGVRNNLPMHAQEIYLEAFNNAWLQYDQPWERLGDASREETAHRVAWSAVKREYQKDERTGMWRPLGQIASTSKIVGATPFTKAPAIAAKPTASRTTRKAPAKTAKRPAARVAKSAKRPAARVAKPAAKKPIKRAVGKTSASKTGAKKIAKPVKRTAAKASAARKTAKKATSRTTKRSTAASRKGRK